MAKLYELAKLIRSKNAGPFQLTIDVLFEDRDTYERVVASGVLSAEEFSKLYGTPAESVAIVNYEAANAIKVTIPRPVTSGDLGDGDMMGGQLYGPLVDLEVA
jgi:uncharacterized protein DUF4387